MSLGRNDERGRLIAPNLGRQMLSTGRAVSAQTGIIVDPYSPLYYSNTYNLVFWGMTDTGVTIGATLRATGASPPVVSITGATNQTLGLYIRVNDVTGGTALGQAKFDWSVDNGSTFVATGVTTAASVVLGATGITAAFAVGPYANDNVYEGTMSQWDDLSGMALNATQATASRQPLITVAGFGGVSAINWGTARTFGLATGNVALGPQSFVAAVLGTAANGYVVTHAGDDNYVFGNASSSIRTNRGATASQKGVTATWIRDSVRKVVGRSFGGTHGTHLAFVNGVQQATTDNTVGDPGTATVTGAIGIGCQPAAFTLGSAGFMRELAVFGSFIPETVHRNLALGMAARASGALVV